MLLSDYCYKDSSSSMNSLRTHVVVSTYNINSMQFDFTLQNCLQLHKTCNGDLMSSLLLIGAANNDQ